MAQATNMQAILDWVAVNRPDLTGLFKQLLSAKVQDTSPEAQRAVLLMAIGFEAGRQFQNDNPTTPLGPLV